MERHWLLPDFQKTHRTIMGEVRILKRDAKVYTVADQGPIPMPSPV